MTQKELLYFEDAIMHIDSITKIINETISKLEDGTLVEFMQDELNKQVNLKEMLTTKLKEKANG